VFCRVVDAPTGMQIIRKSDNPCTYNQEYIINIEYVQKEIGYEDNTVECCNIVILSIECYRML
jgi:hypothetical protein